jgi:hypothetical protein
MKHREFFRTQSFAQRMPARDDLCGSDRLQYELLKIRFPAGAQTASASTLPRGVSDCTAK